MIGKMQVSFEEGEGGRLLLGSSLVVFLEKKTVTAMLWVGGSCMSQQRPFFVEYIQQVLSIYSSTCMYSSC